MSKIKCSVKLIGGFAGVACVVLLLGLVSGFSMASLASKLRMMEKVCLPEVKSLHVLRGALENMRVAQKTPINPELDRGARTQQFANVHTVRVNVAETWKLNEKFSKTTEEDRQRSPALETTCSIMGECRNHQ